jgi:hypothetical protein
MSDRTNTITIVLDKTYRVDDTDAILNAVRMIKGVASADCNVADAIEYMAETRARIEIEQKLWDALKKDS